MITKTGILKLTVALPILDHFFLDYKLFEFIPTKTLDDTYRRFLLNVQAEHMLL